MKLLKQIDDNLYLVDTEADIKTGDLYLHDVCNISTATKEEVDGNILKYCKKIIAQLKDQLSGVALFTLPEEKVDVEKLAEEICKKPEYHNIFGINEGFKLGYHRCLSDNKERKYTKENIYDLVEVYLNRLLKRGHPNETTKEFIDNYLQSLTTTNLQQYDGKEVEIDEILDEFENPMTNPNGVIKIKRIL